MKIELKDTRAKEETYALGDVLLLDDGEAVMLCSVNYKFVAIRLSTGCWCSNPVDFVVGYGIITAQEAADAVGRGYNIVRKLNVKLVEI